MAVELLSKVENIKKGGGRRIERKQSYVVDAVVDANVNKGELTFFWLRDEWPWEHEHMLLYTTPHFLSLTLSNHLSLPLPLTLACLSLPISHPLWLSTCSNPSLIFPVILFLSRILRLQKCPRVGCWSKVELFIKSKNISGEGLS